MPPSFEYRLIVLTHGDCEPLRGTLAAFYENVTPRPTSLYVHRDGPTADSVVVADGIDGIDGSDVFVEVSHPPIGFCEATAKAWSSAAVARERWVFWLEHDFRFVRPVDLGEVALLMDAEPQLAQMSFLRNAVNDEEKRHGGYLQIPGRSYRERVTDLFGFAPVPWFEHTGYWTTNPSLFRREIASDFEWPDGDRCEGAFGFHLKAGRAGTTFGIWGDGREWVEHTTERSGFGY